MTARLLAAASLTLALAACAQSGASPSSMGVTTDLTVFAAASLRTALESVKIEYEAAQPGTSLTIATDSSAALATQIEQGAPADVFLSADTANPQKLVDGGFAAGDPVAFAGNALTIIVPAGNPGNVDSPADLARPGVTIIAAGDEVPIARYARQLVDNLAGEPGFPADFVAGYDANVASKEDNVSGIVAKVELGEGDAGIVYLTDAAAADGLGTIDVPNSANVPATYAGVVVGGSSNRDGARAFLDWLAGPDGQAVLSTFGFLSPP